MLAIVLSSAAAEPQKAPASVVSSPAADGKTSAPATPVAPFMFAPNAAGQVNGGAAGRAAPFSAEIGADFIKKVMETSAKIEEAKRKISERQAHLYATNPEIKSTRARMIEGQAEINRILDADQELADLTMSRDILWSTMPALPKVQSTAAMPRMQVVR